MNFDIKKAGPLFQRPASSLNAMQLQQLSGHHMMLWLL